MLRLAYSKTIPQLMEMKMSRLIEVIPFAERGVVSTIRVVSGIGISVSGAGLLLSQAIRFINTSI
jgi:hypothetical protein